MKKRHEGALCGLICLTLATSCGIMPEEEQLPAAPVVEEVAPIEYTTTIVQRGDIAITKVVNCTYLAAKSETLTFSVSGERVKTTYVKAGDTVQSGDLLVELEMGDLADQLQTETDALDTLNLQKSHIAQQKELAIRRCNMKIQQVQNQIYQAAAPEPETIPEFVPESDTGLESDAEQWPPVGQWPPVEAEPSEGAEPAAEEAEPAAEPETSADSAQTAELVQQLSELEQERTSVQSQYDQRLGEAEDSIYIEKMKIDEIRQKIEKRRVYAGIDGMVTSVRTVDDSETVSEDMYAARIVDPESAAFVVTGEDAADFFPGDRYTVECDDTQYEAVVVDGSELGVGKKKEDEEPSAYLKVAEESPELAESWMAKSITGKITIVTDSRENALYIETGAVKQLDGQAIVYYLDEDGQKSMKEIETGLNTGDYVEVVRGLEEGETIIME